MALIIPMTPIFLTMPIIFSNSFINAISPFQEEAGTSAASINFMQFLTASISANIMSILPDNNQMYFACVSLIAASFMLYQAIQIPEDEKITEKKAQTAVQKN